VNWGDLIFQTFAVFIHSPPAALIPAAAFGAGYAWNRRATTLVAAIAWTLYALWESLIYARVICRGDCNIRVDLLFLYPVLWIVSIAGVIGLLMGRRRRGIA
jgi:hypothetical protein